MDPIDLKVTFSEILRGFSLVQSEYYKTVRIKHFTNFDSADARADARVDCGIAYEEDLDRV